MSARSTPSVSSRLRPTSSTSLLFQPSTSGWYAAWKARKDAAPTPAAAPEAAPEAADAASEALARWLTGAGK
jgi:hypothetical protein